MRFHLIPKALRRPQRPTRPKIAWDSERALKVLMKAIRKQTPLTVIYADKDGVFTERTIEPYDYFLNGAGQPRVIAMCRLREAPRTFAPESIRTIVRHVGESFVLNQPVKTAQATT